MADEALLSEIEGLARAEGRPVAHVVREALEEYVSRRAEEPRPLPDFVGMFRSTGGSDAAGSEEVLEREWAPELEAERSRAGFTSGAEPDAGRRRQQRSRRGR